MGGYSAPEIYNLVTGGPGLDPLFNGQDFTSGQANFQATINQQVVDLNGAMNQYWQGAAVDQAVSGAAPLVSATDAANQSLSSASTTIGSQADAFSVVSTTVVPMAPSPPSNNLGNQIVSFFGANTQLDQQISQYQTDSNTNVQAYNTYAQASSANAAAMPTEYGSLPNASPTFTVTAQSTSAGSGSGFNSSAGGSTGSGTTGGSGYRSPGASTSGGSTGRTSPSGTGTTNTTTPSGTDGSGPGGNGGNGPGGTTTVEDYNPTGTGNVPPYDESLYGPGGIPGGGGSNGDDTNNKNNQYAGGGGVFSGGGGGLGGGEGLGGSGGAGGGANGLGGTGAESQGNRAGVGNMSPGSEEAMSRAAAGAAGEPGMAGGRGQGKKGEDDKEHQTAEYLQEADPDAIFGTDQLTVPPVIE